MVRSSCDSACNDETVRTWTRVSGSRSRRLAKTSGQVDTREAYMPRLRFERLKMMMDSRTSLLPFSAPGLSFEQRSCPMIIIIFIIV